MSGVKWSTEMTDTADAIRRFIVEDLLFDDPDAKVGDDTVLVEGLIDSLGLIQLVAFIEEEFSIEIDDALITSKNLRTIASIEQLVATARSGDGA